MTRGQSFQHHPASVAAARRFATEALRGLPWDVVQSVELMVSELATNCVRHTDSGFDLAIAVGADEVRVKATDRAAGTPTMRSPEPTDAHGRGLLIVDMLASDWGVQQSHDVGKTVWFTVSTTAGAIDDSASGRVDRTPPPRRQPATSTTRPTSYTPLRGQLHRHAVGALGQRPARRSS
jgi:anti-sigma regulatory factor (Ser/Thr protein kinase)